MSMETVEAAPCLHRRTVLAGALAAGVTGGLAACGGGGGSAAAEIPPGAPEGTIAVAADIEVGGGMVISDSKLVITQPTAGEFKAFDTTCSHEGCAVSSISDNVITCPCHGSTFSATDGSVLSPPAPSGLKPKTVKVMNGFISLA
ncbi:MAG: Rieske (2Fe-2S) protein [Sporichthyaceae bacterium]